MMMLKIFGCLMPLCIFMLQVYRYAVTRPDPADRQSSCRNAGIVIFSFGSAGLIYREPIFVFAGLIMMMLGFKLIARGLDRQNKSIFIDRYNNPDN
jgi:hypothetical protein